MLNATLFRIIRQAGGGAPELSAVLRSSGSRYRDAVKIPILIEVRQLVVALRKPSWPRVSESWGVTACADLLLL